MKSASLYFHDLASSTALIDDYHKTLLDIIIWVSDGFIVSIMCVYVLGIAQHVTSDPGQRRDQNMGFKIKNPAHIQN